MDTVGRTTTVSMLGRWAGVVVVLACARIVAADEPPGVDFARQIQPIFVEHCYQCHGPDKQEGSLRLDQRAAALKGGDSGPLVAPGEPHESELLKRVTSLADDERMPPPGPTTKALSPAQIHAITAWISAGAEWPEGRALHWAYQPVARAEPPAVKNTAWPRGAIDRFVIAGLERRGVGPSPEADRATLIKRLSYDLLGLPAAIEEVDAFVSDTSPDAYERLVDRVLDSPHFGERWGRHWLDMARYADSDGYEKDNPRPDAWRYRDWVIDAVNVDMPLDRFTIEQLAGDLLAGATPSERLATAFNRQTLTNTEGGADQEQFRVEAIFDRVATTGAVWLGLTIGCAQCHSHKYDAISQQEYYQLFAFFNNGDEVETKVPLAGEALAKWADDTRDAEQKLAKQSAKLEKMRADASTKLAAWEAELKQPSAGPLAFHPVELVSAKSSAGADLKLLSDGSYLVAGKNADVDEITLTCKIDRDAVSGFRLEALAHDSLGGRGPGRTEHGNFVLSEFRTFAAPTGDVKAEHRVALETAAADYAQNDFPAAHAIDGKEPTGWAIGPQMGRDHWALFLASKPIDAKTTPWVQLVLRQDHGTQHTLGRFRVMAVTGRDPQLGIPQNVRDVLAVAAAGRTPEQARTLLDYFVARDKKAVELAEQIDKLKARVAAEPVMKVRVLAERTQEPRVSSVLHRGDFLQPESPVQPGTLAVLPPLKPRAPAPDRLDLARWLAAADNPLTPRVVVNHIWANLFGRGIVRTVNDFGVRGERPTHPELLDWLAGELVRRGWSRKEMIRLIVSSATYRQASASRPELAEADPLNDGFYRQNRYRVEGEIVRDLALSVSGLLCDQIGGPSVFPQLPAGITDLSYANNFKWNTSTGADLYRRGMYTFFKRTAPHPNLTTFDCPDSNTTCVQRQTSNTPLQALTTLNNESFAEASQALARRLLARGQMADAERLALGLRLCIARSPRSEEVAAFAELLASGRQWYAVNPSEAPKAIGTIAPPGVPADEAAAWVATARILLNLDEFLTRE